MSSSNDIDDVRFDFWILLGEDLFVFRMVIKFTVVFYSVR